jgi:2,3-bisphosphoglycerate-dependent phosphoglycerate mutase
MRFDVAYTSALSRAQETLRLILETSGIEAPVIRDAALNERDYGDLAGLDKAATAERYGAEQVHIWRRSFDIAPPGGESLKDTAARTLPFFERAILEDIRAGRDVLVVAHGNSNRSIVMRLDGPDEQTVTSLEIATGVCRDAAHVEEDLRATAGKLLALGREQGVRFISTGTHPTARYQERKLYPADRYHGLIACRTAFSSQS